MIAVDLDGTLISCGCKQAGVMGQIIGNGFDEVQYWELKRSGLNNLHALIRLGYSPSKAEKASEEWARAIESSSALKMDCLLPGARSFLHSDMDFILVTARRRSQMVNWQLQCLGILNCFQQIFCVEPERGVAAKAEVLRASQPCCFIGDSEVDCDSSRSAGIPFLGVLTGQRSEDFWRANRPGTSLFRDLDAIHNIIGERCGFGVNSSTELQA